MLMRLLLSGVLLIVSVASATEISGSWIARVSGATLRDPQYARVELQPDGSRLTGTWSDLKLSGSVTGDKVQLSLMRADGKPAGQLTGRLAGSGNAAQFSGDGTLEMRGFGAERRGGGSAPVTWSLVRAAVRS